MTLRHDTRARMAVVALAGLIAAALFAPWLAPADPLAQPDVLRTRFLAPFSAGPDGSWYWLGTDQFGRDLLSRLLYGARISLVVGAAAVALSVAIGAAVGVTAALAGGAVERMLMAGTDAALALPRLVLLLALAALWDPSLLLVVAVLGVTGWMGIARLTRAEVKAVMGRAYIEAARATGVPWPRLLWRHVVPNAATPVIIAAALGVGNAITLESGLAFLGLGVPAPAPSWGNMIAAGRDALVFAPWIAVFPGLALVTTVVATNLLGDALQDALNPALALGRAAPEHAVTLPTPSASPPPEVGR